METFPPDLWRTQAFMKIYFPVVSQGPASESTDILPTGFTMSQVWTLVWEGASWFSNRVWGAAFRKIVHFEPSPFTNYPLSYAGKKYSRVGSELPNVSLASAQGCSATLQITGSPEVTMLATAVHAALTPLWHSSGDIPKAQSSSFSAASTLHLAACFILPQHRGS